MADSSVSAQLTADEALVLFELLTRYSDLGQLSVQDQAEQRALWNLLASLEKALAEPVRKDYTDLLAQARARLRDE